uniref:Ribonuclease H-like domain, reverse transcriptase, RNA-dependent DNA polymerase n=1 Tax=Tanacetum cinerariifolium TaxID=118510 RepID=A0A6L2MQ32_TANCI|nr:ribonuclease H-like domain, reverse transcriptase, RNA-dependent DNA polymerase [Tanacetum cinerariifolium]
MGGRVSEPAHCISSKRLAMKGLCYMIMILVDLPFRKKAIGTKWVYRRIDYDEVFAPMAKIEAIRIFLAFASYMGFIVYQIDVKSVFLYGTIDEEIYLSQPPSFVDPKLPNKVYKVVKALYGLHQTPRAWFRFNLKTSHLQDMKRIFRYLKGQPKLGLWYPKVSSFDLEVYLDSNYAGVNLDRKSTTVGCQFLGRRLILWQCKKHTIVATSTTEAEYVATAHCCG